MAETVLYVVPVEVVRRRRSDVAWRGLARGPRAHGGRAEVFAPFSVVWPSDGIALRGEHRGLELARAVPTRDADGSLRIETRATRRSSPPTPPASTSLLSFTRSLRFARRAGYERFNARC